MIIDELAALGVPASKIRLLFNQVAFDDELPKAFSCLYSYHRRDKRLTLNPAAVMHENELYSRLKASGADIAQLLADDTDYKAAIRAMDDPQEKQRLAYRLATRRLELGIVGELDATFTALLQ